MFKYETVAKVGQRIRSYDFEGRRDCYVEGIVLRLDTEGKEQGFAAIVINVTKDVFPKPVPGKGRVDQTVYVPMEVSFSEHEGRIINLSHECPMARLNVGDKFVIGGGHNIYSKRSDGEYVDQNGALYVGDEPAVYPLYKEENPK